MGTSTTSDVTKGAGTAPCGFAGCTLPAGHDRWLESDPAAHSAGIPLTAGMVIGALTGRAGDLRQQAQRAYERASGTRGRRASRALERLGHGYMDRSLDLTLVAERVQQAALESRRG